MASKSLNENILENDRLLALEEENARLKRLVAELLVKNQSLRDTLCHAEVTADSDDVLLPNLLMF